MSDETKLRIQLAIGVASSIGGCLAIWGLGGFFLCLGGILIYMVGTEVAEERMVEIKDLLEQANSIKTKELEQ